MKKGQGDERNPTKTVLCARRGGFFEVNAVIFLISRQRLVDSVDVVKIELSLVLKYD